MRRYTIGLLLVLPALAVIVLLFVVPLAISIYGAFESGGRITLDNFTKAFELYWADIVYTVGVIGLSTALIGLFAIAIGGYLTLGSNPRAVAILRWLYRWPMFVPFIVVGQVLRTFLAKNGILNNTLVTLGALTPVDAQSYLDWRGMVFAFVWKQTPFVALLVAGAMASLDRAGIEAAMNLGASKSRILFGIVVPQVATSLLVALVLSFVTMMSVLSVPLMINAQSPTVITADIAFRINSYSDYGVANALGVVSLVIASAVAWIYLRHSLKEYR